MAERRYSRYKREHVWAALYQQQDALGVIVQHDSVQGNTLSLLREGQPIKAVVLARSSDWYAYSLNCEERWHHGIEAVVCGTHDSCLPVVVLALDTLRWYEPTEMRVKSLAPRPGPQGNPTDTFEQKYRKTHYGHNMLLGALMCGRPDAVERLKSLPQGTRWRIEAEIRRLHMRRRGRPLRV